MKTQVFRNAVLALVALLSLSIYILACTSFSPDDTKVLYPAFDGTNGAVGVAVYDRGTRRSEMLFVAAAVRASNSNSIEPAALRPQWLADGRHVLVAWPVGDPKNDGLNVAVTPLDRRTPLRIFALPTVDEAGPKLAMSLGLIGHRLFVMETDQTVLRLDLETGEVTRRAIAGTNQQAWLYPALDGKDLFCIEERPNESKVFSRFDPETLQCQQVFTFTNEPADGTFVAFDRVGPRLALVEQKRDHAREVVVLSAGQPVFMRPVPGGENELSIASMAFGRRGELIVASYRRELKDKRGSEFGLLEIPLSQAPIRDTVLVHSRRSGDGLDTLYFQASLSHDGKTAAVASTYLAAAGGDISPEETALFLVDLSGAKRKVTRVPVLPPPGGGIRRF